ncbi:MAG: TasA family protein [Candidatus Nanohaloarchaea archaeon]
MNKHILASLIIIGLVGIGLGSTTMAMFNDTETSQGNQFTAGELDLKVDWEESYNGEHVETQNLTNDPGAIFDFEDLKPGDHGEATISLHLEDNPGWIWMNLNQTSNWDNACTEPERKAEGQCGSEGELDEELEFVIWADDGDNVLQDDENVIFEGTAQELEEQSTAEGLLLDGDTSTNETEPFAGEETGYIGMKWNLPLETGNHIQGDSVSYDVEFYTEQRRHNDNPDNPWDSENDTEEPEEPVNETPENEFYQVDFVEGEPQEDLSEESYSEAQRMQRYAHGGPDNPVDNESESDQVFSASGGEDCVDSNAFTTDLDEDTMSVEFDVHNDSSCEDIELSLVSYEKPYAGWIEDRADEQEIFDSETETFSPGSHCMTVDIPDVNDGESDNPGSCEDEAEDPNESEGDNGDDNGETVCEEPQNSSMEHTADEIGQAMYGYDFEDLSSETRCEVEELFNNQPFAEGLELGDLMTRDEISQDKFEMDYDEISSDSKSEVDQAYNDQFMDEETEPSDTLSFSDQNVTEEGTVEVNDVTTNQASTVFVTYESEDGLVNAGAHGASNIEDFDGMEIELEGPERSGDYTAHIIPTENISSSYSLGDTLSDSTASASLFAETANITGLESESGQ